MSQSEPIWRRKITAAQHAIKTPPATVLYGRITRVTGLVMEAVGLKLPVGSACLIPLGAGTSVEAEVVGFQDNRLFMMPQSDVDGIVPGAPVCPMASPII
jgi:flagellum-specific ATP synthase